MGNLQKILVLVNMVVVLAGAGLVYYAHNMIKPQPTDQVAETENLKKEALDQVQVQAVPIKKFVVNIHSRSTRLRYLDVEMNILPFRNEQKEIIKANEHIFKDVVIEIAARLEPEELDSLSGKILFEKKVKDRVNEKLGQPGDPLVNKIYFSGFVVQ
jgi:flagellar FliL protein